MICRMRLAQNLKGEVKDTRKGAYGGQGLDKTLLQGAGDKSNPVLNEEADYAQVIFISDTGRMGRSQ